MSSWPSSLDDFLERAHGAAFCDACLALQVGVPLLEMRAALEDTSPRARRAPGRCSVCGRTVDVTHAPVA